MDGGKRSNLTMFSFLVLAPVFDVDCTLCGEFFLLHNLNAAMSIVRCS